jgi:small subunit ribosomal protein S17
MDKTITVKIERRVKHPVYGKYITRSSKVHAHDEENKAGMGDTVLVAESRRCLRARAGPWLRLWRLRLRFEAQSI